MCEKVCVKGKMEEKMQSFRYLLMKNAKFEYLLINMCHFGRIDIKNGTCFELIEASLAS